MPHVATFGKASFAYFDHFPSLPKVTSVKLRTPCLGHLTSWLGYQTFLYMQLGFFLVEPMINCGLPFMELQPLVDRQIAKATLQQPKTYYPNMLRVGQLAKPLHPYKALRL